MRSEEFTLFGKFPQDININIVFLDTTLKIFISKKLAYQGIRLDS
jgi:hypothetical protein